MTNLIGMTRYLTPILALAAALTLPGGVLTPVSARMSSPHAPVPPGALRCTASSLTVHGGRQGGGFGTAEGTVVVTNSSHSPCYLASILGNT
jgi:hypothetical protein